MACMNTGEDAHADHVHSAEGLPSRTPSPFFWKDAVRDEEYYDATTSADRVPCRICLYPLVEKKRAPCAGCKRLIMDIIVRKHRSRGPASNRWVAPEDVTEADMEKFEKMSVMARRQAKYTLDSMLWSRAEGYLLTRSKNCLKEMNTHSLVIKDVVTGFNPQGHVTRRPNEKMRKKLSRLTQRLSEEQTLLSHQRLTWINEA